ncbi:MAG TPA: glycosyltransferase [Chitinophagales bacterium]|nr:glycosyltransferase [Chitinophagales bacterium]
MERRNRILVAVLDWGLGHATRSVPVIRALIARNCTVFVASSGGALALLKLEFPNLTFFELPGYNPIYPTDDGMVLKMAAQLPGFIKTIQEEHKILQRLIKEYKIEAVISDNRWGCYAKGVKTVFITHQVNIIISKGFATLEKLVNYYNHQYIGKFDKCWVPDFEGAKSLAGKLSANTASLKQGYIGPLTRFKKIPAEKKYNLVYIASGPEPQKSIFTDLVKKQAAQIADLQMAWVLGNTDLPEKELKNYAGKALNHLKADELNLLAAQSEIVLCRSGYSSIMDLAQLGAKAIFVPTPGQTEQEYLAETLLQKGIAYYEKQAGFDLQRALKEAPKYTGFVNFEKDTALLEAAIDSLL